MVEKREEEKLVKNKMYIIFTPVDDIHFNITCMDSLKKPVGDLYYLLRGIMDMAIKNQDVLIQLGKDVVIKEQSVELKNRFGENIIPFKLKGGNGKKH